MKKSVIDVGSNSVRLFLSSAARSEKIIKTTMLARDMQGGFLDCDAIRRTVLAIADFLKMAADFGCSKPAIFATEAVRAAKNQAEFIAQLKCYTDIPLDILTGDEEATISFLGAAIDYRNGFTGSLGVIDIGGASVEYAYGKPNEILYKKSLPLGAIAIKNACGDDKQRIKDYIESMIVGFDRTLSPTRLIGVSGTLTSLAAMDLGLTKYDPSAVHGHRITLEALIKLEGIIFSDEPLTQIFKTLSPSRAQIIKQGITLIIALLSYFDLSEITISEKDNLEGYIIHRGI